MNDYREIIEINECARCNYNELKGSLHVHHIDRNHENDTPKNLIVLCANCHFGLHHKKWKLSEIGIFGFDDRITKNTYKENTYLKVQNDSLLHENNILKSKLNNNYSKIQDKKRIALYSYLSNFSDDIRDGIAFFLDYIPDTFFDCIETETEIYTQDITHSIYEMYSDYKKDANINIENILKTKMNTISEQKQKMKDSEMSLTEFYKKLSMI